MTNQTDTMNTGTRAILIEETIWRAIEEAAPSTRDDIVRPWYDVLDDLTTDSIISADGIYTMLERAYNSGHAMGRQGA